MGILKISSVKAGMELVEPVMNIQGRVLFKAGDVITEKHLKAFKAWGVTEVNIKDNKEIESAANDEKTLEVVDEKTQKTIAQEVDYLFQMADKNDPIIMELYRLTIKKQLMKKGR